jgi:uncharacterized protein (TIGR00369 family)
LDNIALLQQALDVMFPKTLGMRLTEATPDRVRAELTVTTDICTSGNTIHGGAVMTMADFLGASGTFLNLPPGAGTTTIESKTNFIATAAVGQKVEAVCEPVHKGKMTHVWRTTVRREDGRVIAVVTQTQMVLLPQQTPEQTVAGLFQGKGLDEQKALLAGLERAGAGLYRAFAAEEADDSRRQALLQAADREEENARILDDRT